MRVDITNTQIADMLERTGHAATSDNVQAVCDALRDTSPLLKMLIAGLELPNRFTASPLF